MANFVSLLNRPKYLNGDPDRDYLLDGIKTGFNIIDNFDMKPVEIQNHKSSNDPLVHLSLKRLDKSASRCKGKGKVVL